MKKLMFMAMVATIAVVACEKEVGVEDEGTTGTRAYLLNNVNGWGVILLSHSDTIWRGRNGSRHFYFF